MINLKLDLQRRCCTVNMHIYVCACGCAIPNPSRSVTDWEFVFGLMSFFCHKRESRYN